MEQIFPVLTDAVGWVIIYILLLNIVGIFVGGMLWFNRNDESAVMRDPQV